jgi:hypothetical protein
VVTNPDTQVGTLTQAITYQDPAWHCGARDYFLTLHGQVYRSADLITWTAVGTGNHAFNALAFNVNDHYLYGVGIDGTKRNYHHLLRIRSNGSAEDMGLIKGLPDWGKVGSGDFDQTTGKYWVSNNEDTFWVIDIAKKTAKTIPSPVAGKLGADMVVKDGTIITGVGQGIGVFTIQGNKLSKTVHTLTVSNQRDGAYGAMWIDTGSGDILMRENSTGEILSLTQAQLALSSADATVVGDTDTGSPVDGATCIAPPA